MDKEKIMEAMGHIDPALVEAADAAGTARRRKGWKKPALIAACLCLVLAGTAVAATGISKIRVTGWYDNERILKGVGDDTEYSGFEIMGGMAYIPGEQFSEEVNQIALEHPHDSVYKTFGTWSAMEEFIGWELMDNPVLEAARPANTPPCHLHVSTAEELTGLTVYAWYGLHSEPRLVDHVGWVYDEVSVWLSADLRTAYYLEMAQGEMDEDELSWEQTAFQAGSSYVQEEYVTPSGLEAAIIQVTQPDRKELRYDEEAEDHVFVSVEPTSYIAYFSLNGARFSIRAGHDTDAGLALETLKEVLDGFVVEPAA